MKRKALRAFLHLPQESENMTTGSFEKGITRILAGKREDSQGTGIGVLEASSTAKRRNANMEGVRMKMGKEMRGRLSAEVYGTERSADRRVCTLRGLRGLCSVATLNSSRAGAGTLDSAGARVRDGSGNGNRSAEQRAV